jgi:hypothetical protein
VSWSRWTPERLEQAKRVLARHRGGDIQQACKELGVSISSLYAAFARAGLGSPASFCRQPDPPPDSAAAQTLRRPSSDDPPPTMRSARPAELDPERRRDERDERVRARREVELLTDRIRELRARQSFLDEVAAHQGPPRIHPRERTSGVREMAAVVLASDWHVEESVDPAAVAGRNAYDLEVADRRVRRFFRGIVWNVEHHRASGRLAIRDLVLWLGGDLMTGYIHEELLEGNALSPTETILWLIPRLRDGIASLLEILQLERLIVPCSYGNHGRTTAKRRVATGAANSFEWLMYHHLADAFRGDPRVHFEIASSAHQYVEVFGRTLHFHHGDELKYQGGVGGVGIPLLKRVPQWDRLRRAEVHNIGHFHQLLDYGCAVVNGSLIGYGPYSQSIGASPEPPQQLMYMVDRTRGKCLTTQLWVERAAGADAPRPAD